MKDNSSPPPSPPHKKELLCNLKEFNCQSQLQPSFPFFEYKFVEQIFSWMGEIMEAKNDEFSTFKFSTLTQQVPSSVEFFNVTRKWFYSTVKFISTWADINAKKGKKL